MMDYERRKKALRAVMEAEGMDGTIVLSPENIFYLTGSPFVHGSVGKILHLGKNGSDSLIVSDIDYEEVVDKSVGVEVVKTDFLIDQPPRYLFRGLNAEAPGRGNREAEGGEGEGGGGEDYRITEGHREGAGACDEEVQGRDERARDSRGDRI
jgi:Xaa-Pro aminopeptidase